MSPESLPPYVDWGGDQTYPQPLLLQGNRFRGYVLPADVDALQGLCDRYLNGPAGGVIEYRPALPRVMLGIADIARISCTSLPADRQFWLPEIDAGFWVPLLAGRRIGGLFVAERIVWFLPYLVVNQPWAYTSGRELYGFPKEFGPIVVPKDLDDPTPITVDTSVVPEFGPDAEVRTARLVEVTRTGGSGIASAWGDWAEVLRELATLLVGDLALGELPWLGLAVDLHGMLTTGEVPLAFLKQFRDVADGRRACYQTIVEAPARVIAFRGGGWLAGDHAVTIHPYASHPIAADLGLGGPTIPSLASLYLDLDFAFENGREVVRVTP